MLNLAQSKKKISLKFKKKSFSIPAQENIEHQLKDETFHQIIEPIAERKVINTNITKKDNIISEDIHIIPETKDIVEEYQGLDIEKMSYDKIRNKTIVPNITYTTVIVESHKKYLESETKIFIENQIVNTENKILKVSLEDFKHENFGKQLFNSPNELDEIEQSFFKLPSKSLSESKLYFEQLTEKSLEVTKSDFVINLNLQKREFLINKNVPFNPFSKEIKKKLSKNKQNKDDLENIKTIMNTTQFILQTDKIQNKTILKEAIKNNEINSKIGNIETDNVTKIQSLNPNKFKSNPSPKRICVKAISFQDEIQLKPANSLTALKTNLSVMICLLIAALYVIYLVSNMKAKELVGYSIKSSIKLAFLTMPHVWILKSEEISKYVRRKFKALYNSYFYQ